MNIKILVILLITVVSCSKNGENQLKKQELIDEKNEIEFEALNVRTSLVDGLNTIPNSSLDFATLQPKQSAIQDLIITNGDSNSLAFGSGDINANDISPFVMTETCSNKSIARNRSCKLSFSIVNNPSTSEIVLTKSLTIKGSVIQLTATLAADTTPVNQPIVSLIVSPLILDFGSMKSGEVKELSVAITNKGSTSQTISPPSLSNPKISLTSNTCSSLARNRSCSMKFSYTASNDESISQQSFTSIANNDIKYSVLIQSPTVSEPEVLNVNPSISSSNLNLTVPQVHNGTLSFSNSGTLILPPTVQLVASPATGFSVSSVSCSGGLARGRTCSASYSLNSALLPEGSSQIQIRLQSGTLASNPHTVNLSIPVTGPSVACTSLNPTQLQSLGYTTTHIATVSGNTPNCVIETCVPYYERAGGTEAKTCNPKACNGLDSQELIDLDYIDDASGAIGYNPQEYLSGTYPSCSISCPAGYEVNPSNPKRCQAIQNIVSYQINYSSYGVCSALEPCQGVGTRTRTYSCNKLVNGNFDSVVANSFCENEAIDLQSSCSSPMGQISVSILNGSKLVSCLEGSEIQAYVSNSLSCSSGFIPNENTQQCEQEIINQEPNALIGQMKSNSTGNSFFKLDENFNITEINTNINNKTMSSSVGFLTFVGNDLFFLMDSDAYGTELFKLTEGSTNPEIINYDVSALNSFTSVNNPLIIHNGFAYFNARTISNSNTIRCAAVNLSNPSSTVYFQSSCNNLIVVNGNLYAYMIFDASTGAELVRINGQALSLVADINPGSANSNISLVTSDGNDLYFVAKNPTVANTPSNGVEIFRYNTATNSLTVFDTISGTTGAVINSSLQVYSGNIFYREGSSVNRYNTTTLQKTTITTGTHSNNFSSNTFVGVGGSVYFNSTATSGLGTEVLRHVLSTGVTSVLDFTSGTSSTFPAHIKTDGTNVFVRSTTKIFKYTVSSNQIQQLDLSSPSFGNIDFIGSLNVDSNNLYYIASQSSPTGFGNEFFKYSIATGEKTMINICDDSVQACQGVSGIVQDIKIHNNYIYIIGGNNITGKSEIVKINNLNNTFEILDVNKMKVGIRENDANYPVEHIVSDNKIFFAGEDNNGLTKLWIKDLSNNSPPEVQILPTPYLDNYPSNFYESENYVYFGAKIAQTEQKLFQYNKLTGNIVGIDFPSNQSAMSSYLTTFHNGKYYMSVNESHIYVYDEFSNVVSPLVTAVPYNPNNDPQFDQATYQANCQANSPDPMNPDPCPPLEPQLMNLNNSRNPIVFNNVLYFTGTIYGWDTYSSSISFVGYGVYRLNNDNSVTLLTPNFDSMNPGIRFDPAEPIMTVNHLLYISTSFPTEAYHVYKDNSGDSVEEYISFMDYSSGYPSHLPTFFEDNQKNLYFTDIKYASSVFQLAYQQNSIQTVLGQGNFSIQNLIANGDIINGGDIREIIDLDAHIMLQYNSSKLLKCSKDSFECVVIGMPESPLHYFVSGLYKFGNFVLFSKEESQASLNYGNNDRKLYKLNLLDNSVTEILFNGDGIKINKDLIPIIE